MATPSKNHDWLAQTVEAPLDPALPICDPHHHLWDQLTTRIAPRYLMDEIQEDVGAGHNVVSTVFIECGAMFKSDGPEPLRPVGETEFVNGIAAMSASGLYGKTRVAAGIVGTANLRLGDAVGAVLDAQPGTPTSPCRAIAPSRDGGCCCATISAWASPSSRRAS